VANAQCWVTGLSLLLGTICFILYVLDALHTIAAKKKAASADIVGVATGPEAKGLGVGEFTKLLEAISKLTDSLAKAGPSLTSLIGAILFYAIAAVASGALHDTPPDKPARHAAAAGPTNETQ
jgi:hypothetical protein